MAAERKHGEAGERARAARADEGNGAEVLGGSASLDPYSWERPLESVHRHSRILDATAAKGTSADRRTSRLPPGVSLFDPFGYGVSAETSRYDSALAYSTSPPVLSPSPSLSPYATSSSMSMTSLGSSMTTVGSLQPWNSDQGDKLGAPWEKRRSVSMGEVKGGSASRSSMGPGLRVTKLSKLSGEVDALSLSTALEPMDVVLAAGIVPADEDYINSRLYQRTQKARVALEKERRKSLAQDSSSTSHRKSTISLVSTASSTKRSSMSWFKSRSEVAISTERIPVTPPLPSPASFPRQSVPRQRSLSDVASASRHRQDGSGARGGPDGGSVGGRRQEDRRRRGDEGRRHLDVPAPTSSSEPSSPRRPRLATAASIPLPPSPRRSTPTPDATTDASSRHTPSPSPSSPRDNLGIRVDERPKRAPSPLPTTMLLPLSSSHESILAVDTPIVPPSSAPPPPTTKPTRNPPSPSSSASSTNSPTTPDAPGPTLPPGAAAPTKGGVYRNGFATKSKSSLAGLFSRSTKDLSVRSSDVVPPLPRTMGREEEKVKEKGSLFSRARSFIGSPAPDTSSIYRGTKMETVPSYPTRPMTTAIPKRLRTKSDKSFKVPKTSFFGSFAPPPPTIIEKDLPRSPRLDGTR